MDQRKFIIEQRAKGVSDDEIYDAIQARSEPAPKRSGAGEFLPAAFSVGGGILGGIGGALGGPVGAFAGGVAGATAGGALGETIQQGIEKRYGQRESFNTPQIAGSGAISGVTQAVGGALFKGGSIAANLARPKMLKVVSYLSGYADSVLEKALTRSSGVLSGLREGEKSLVDIVKRSAAKVQDLASATLKESKEALEKFDKLSSGGAGLPGTRQGILEEGRKFIGNLTQRLRADYNIGVEKNGSLLFSRGVQPSRIATMGDQKTIQEAFSWVNTIKNNTTIKHIDAVLERLIVLKSKTPSGTPTGPESKRIVGEMIDEVVAFTKSLGNISNGYIQYAEFLGKNLPKRVMIGDAREFFGSTRNPSPKDISKITTQLLQLFNTGKLSVREGVETVGKEIGEDVTGTSAGTLINTGDQMSIRAPNLTMRGIAEKVIEFIPRAVVQNYIKTGKLVGGALEEHPVLQATARLIGVSVKTLAQEVAQLLGDKTTR